MKRVTGIGGVFFKSSNPQRMKNWYQKHLGIESNEYGATFEWRDSTEPKKKCYTAWSPFTRDTDYFNPSKKDFMLK